jgi:hypothetical protein
LQAAGVIGGLLGHGHVAEVLEGVLPGAAAGFGLVPGYCAAVLEPHSAAPAGPVSELNLG